MSTTVHNGAQLTIDYSTYNYRRGSIQR